MASDAVEYPTLLTPGEVARLFRVDPKTVSRWASSGLLPSIRTLGGHRRFRASDVESRLARLTQDSAPGKSQGDGPRHTGDHHEL